MESMLSMASAKMTGLDLGGGSAKTKNDEEMLTTPKCLPDSASGLMLSPRGFPAVSSTSASTSAKSRTTPMVNGNSSKEDLLTTPVLTTPKTSDLWSSSARDSLALPSSFSPEDLSPTAPLELGPRNPPKDLPMDSDIGLRSPCDGLLAKRRKFKTQQAASSTSVNSNDSNSCDTPTSQNSPRDLTMRNSNATGEDGASTSESMATNNVNSSVSNSKPSSGVPSPAVPQSPRAQRDFKHPLSKPENLKFPPAGLELPSHYTPSPLAVPSPNWSAAEKILGADLYKTPKQLDSHCVFDFLSPPPLTPRTKLSFRDRSPGHESDRYSGRDQRLSPRLSPRFPIPEAPTDLSSKGGDRVPSSLANGGLGDPPPYPESAQDLSTKGSSGALSKQNTPSPPNVQIQPHLPLKQEFNPMDEHHMGRSRTPSGHSSHTGENIKSETPDDYESGYAGNTSFVSNVNAPPIYLPERFQLYQRGGLHPDLIAARHLRGTDIESGFDMAKLSPQQYWGGAPNLHQPPTSQAPWPPHIHHEDEESVSPPPGPPQVFDPTKLQLLTLKASQSLTASPVSQKMALTPERKRRGKSATPTPTPGGGNDEGPQAKKRNKGKGKAQKDPNGTKRVYTCPHCQRSYDWNYNLNRHLKYECGKENAFQCSKCGRKFPHKQNCVYHLKRKHKIVCDTIDQYMAAGLVLFRGSAGPSGQQTAKPAMAGDSSSAKAAM